MVRYIKHGEHPDESVICHYQVPGAKHGVRRYQYPDGTYTPLGREHYGIGVKKNRTNYEKIRDKTKAAIETAKGYRIIRKKEKEKLRAQQLENRKQAYQVAERIAKQTAEAKRDILSGKAAINEENAKKRHKQNIERDKKLAENLRKELQGHEDRIDEFKEKLSESRKEKQIKGDKDDKFDKLSTQELNEYTNRLYAEKNAREAEIASKLQKLGAPFQVINQIASYGETAIRAYSTYEKIKQTLNKNKNTVVNPSQIIAKKEIDNIVKDFVANDYDVKKTLNLSDKANAQNILDTLKKIQQIENLARGNSGNNGNNNGGNNGNNGNNNGNKK